MTTLNRFLAAKQGLTQDEINFIEELHTERLSIFSAMEKLSKKSDFSHFVKNLEILEFKLQRAWKFPETRSMHSWWFRVPHCSCPKDENEIRRGIELRIINKKCPVHKS